MRQIAVLIPTSERALSTIVHPDLGVDDVPIGAVVVRGGRWLAYLPFLHAEGLRPREQLGGQPAASRDRSSARSPEDNEHR